MVFMQVFMVFTQVMTVNQSLAAALQTCMSRQLPKLFHKG